MSKKLFVSIVSTTAALAAILLTFAYFMPHIFLDYATERSFLLEMQPNRYTLPIIVRMAKHGEISSGTYRKSEKPDEWANLIGTVRDPAALPYLRELEKNNESLIGMNARKAIKEIETSGTHNLAAPY